MKKLRQAVIIALVALVAITTLLYFISKIETNSTPTYIPAESEVSEANEAKENINEAIEGIEELMETAANAPVYLFYYDAIEADENICRDISGWDRQIIGSIWKNFNVPIAISENGIRYHRNNVLITKEYPVSLWYSDQFDNWYQIDFCLKGGEVFFNVIEE